MKGIRRNESSKGLAACKVPTHPRPIIMCILGTLGTLIIFYSTKVPKVPKNFKILKILKKSHIGGKSSKLAGSGDYT